ncbi:MAG: phage baseplate assembly protein V [Lachnospiraceae bacterium]|nr:phage baseplate assembly protein V [Lachnospiraceae bacterium]
MALFDIIDDMTEKQMMKTETGDNRIFGVVVGQVALNYDKDMPGRVCVTVPTRDEGANELKWARVAMMSGGSGWGHYFLPEVGDQVLLAFEQGNIEKPYVIGCIPKDSDEIVTGSVDEDNQFKKIATRNGNLLCFEDNKEGNGEKDKVKLITAKQLHRIELDNENSLIVISDKDGKNQIKMDTKNGAMEVIAEKKLTIKVGEKIEVSMDGSSGEISIKASKHTESMQSEVSIAANSTLKLEAATLEAAAKGSLKLSSSGAVTISGTPIKIG